jgi:hypothetical protein
MPQMLVVGARLFAGDIASVVDVPTPARRGFSLGLVVGEPLRLGEHCAVQAHVEACCRL